MPFKAPKNFNPAKPGRGTTGGVRDQAGNEWVWDPNKHEWDVQTPKPRQPGKWNHTNVGENGEITHGPDNTARVIQLTPSSYSYLGNGATSETISTGIAYGGAALLVGISIAGIAYWLAGLGGSFA